MVHSKKEKGDYATIRAMSDLTKSGYTILAPVVSEHLPFDFIAYKNGHCFRIQVKYSSDGIIKNVTNWSDKNGSHARKYSIDDFDYYAIYLPAKDVVVYPNIKFGGSTIAFEVPNSATPFYWWEDFLSFTDNAEKRIYREFGVELTQSWKSNPLFKSGTKEREEMNLKKRKVTRPSKEELQKLLWEKPTSQLAKDFGVSDKAIEKWAKAYGLSKPGRGYWPSKTDLESWKKVFEEAQRDPNFKIIVHSPVETCGCVFYPNTIIKKDCHIHDRG